MKAPMSPEIAALLQDPRAARNLMNAVLESRTALGKHSITVRQGDKVTRYKSVTAIHRSNNN